MSIRPVDYQMMMPKVNEIARVQNEQQHKVIANAQQQADNSVKQAEQNTKSVHSQDEANKVNNQEKQKGGKDQSKEKEEKEQKQKESKPAGKNDGLLPQERHTIDIRL
jgi:hypothetical protein